MYDLGVIFITTAVVLFCMGLCACPVCCYREASGMDAGMIFNQGMNQMMGGGNMNNNMKMNNMNNMQGYGGVNNTTQGSMGQM